MEAAFGCSLGNQIGMASQRKNTVIAPVPWVTFQGYGSRVVVGLMAWYGFFKMFGRHEWLVGIALVYISAWAGNGFKNPWKKKAKKLSRPCLHQHSRPRAYLGSGWPFASWLKWLLVPSTFMFLRFHLAHRKRVAKTRKSLIAAFGCFWGTLVFSGVLLAALAIFWGAGIQFFFSEMAKTQESRAFWMFGMFYLTLLPTFYGLSIFGNAMIHIGWFGGDRQAVKRILEAVMVVVGLYAMSYFFLVDTRGEGHIAGIREYSTHGSIDVDIEDSIAGWFGRSENHRHQVATIADCIYFSTMVLVAGGAEGIEPVSTVAKALTLSEMAIGWFFLVVCISTALGRERRYTRSTVKTTTAPANPAQSTVRANSGPLTPSHKKQSKKRKRNRR